MVEKTTKSPVVKKIAAPKVEKPAVVKKAVVKAEQKVAVKKEKTVEKPAIKKQAGLSIDVIDITGKTVETITLPESVFGAKLNKQLIAQAVRVYQVNQRRGTASTKDRGEVDGSTRKIYRQKGTGRARHGGIRAPLFVKGGVAHGPKPKDYSLSMPKKMKQRAFSAALSSRLQDNAITVVSGLATVALKTKTMAEIFGKIGISDKKRNTLLVLPKDMENVFKAARNIKGIGVTTAERMNVYEALVYRQIVFMREAIDVFAKTHEGKAKK